MLRIKINISYQQLDLYNNDQLQKYYHVSTSKYGPGELSGSFRTPRGRHMIRAKIGAGQPENTVFVQRRPTGGNLFSRTRGAISDARLDSDPHPFASQNRREPG